MKRQEAIDILARHHAEIAGMGVRSLAIFGSVARDEADPKSDIDMLIEFRSNCTVGLFRFIEIKQYLEGLLHCSVDLGMADMLRQPIRDQALKEAVRVA